LLSNIRNWLWVPIVILILISLWYGISHGGNLPEGQTHFGIFSLIPAIVTLALCFYTRNVILALFVGVVLGGLISANYNILNAYLIPSLGSKKYAQILLVYLWALGGLIGMWNKNGGALYFANYVAKKFVRSRVTAKLFGWVMGVIFHQGGTISTVLTGTTVKPVADRERVSHEELSYIVDSTASPIATLIPFNAWPAYIAGLITIGSLSQIVPDESAARGWFYKAIPLNFYSMFAVFFTLLFSLDKMFFMGKKMRRAVHRVVETGELDDPESSPLIARELNTTNVPEGYVPGMSDFLIPLGVLLGFSIIPWLYTKAVLWGFPIRITWMLTDSPLVFEAFGLSVLSAVVFTRVKGMKLNDIFDGLIDGIKGVTVGAIILGLAVTLGYVSETLGTSNYVIETTAGIIKQIPYILPGLLMFICMFISFSIGSSWGTYAVVYPIALPLAYAVHPDSFYFTLNFAAIMGGAVFGDQCSPISDTTILSAMACGTDLMDHVTTQLPMALLAATCASFLYVVISYINFM
jgi:Na+/H+ antiporter NhaC